MKSQTTRCTSSPNLPDDRQKNIGFDSEASGIFSTVGMFGVILGSLTIMSQHNYLLFHTLAELISVAVSTAVFLLVWNSRHYTRNSALVVLGVGYLCAGIIDLLHVSAYKGMGVFVESIGADLSIQLGLAGRILYGFSLLMFSLALGKQWSNRVILVGYLICTSLLLASILWWQIFPSCFIEGSGLTVFKKSVEYFVCILLILSFFLLSRRKNALETTVSRLISTSIVLTIGVEVFLTVYTNVFGLSNIISHLLKIISFFLIYFALIRLSLTRPYAVLFREMEKITENLNEKEERLRFLVGNSSDCLVIINADGSLRYVSPAAVRISGYPVAELEGRSINTLIHPDDLQDFMVAWNEAIEHPGKTVTVQYRHIHKTLEWVFFEAITQSFLNDPAINGIIASIRNITEHKRVEGFLKDVITKNPMSIQILDKDGLTLEVNHSYKSLFGAVPPSGYSLFSDPQLLQMGLGELFDQLRNGATVRFPDTYFNAHDSVPEFPDVPAWVRALGFPLNDSNGKPEKFVLMHENITEGKQAEEALRESEETFRNIVQASPMGIHLYQLQKDDRLVFVGSNPAADKLLGVDNTQFIGMTLEEAFPPLKQTEIPSRYRRAAQYGESWHTEQIDYDHDKIDGAYDVYAFQMSLGKVAVLFNDITERKLAEKEREMLQMQLAQAQKMEAIGQLAGGVAHDFNNMLGVIIGYSEMILEQAGPSRQFDAELAEIQKAARRSADLTRQLLTFARKQTVAPRVLDLNQTIEGMLNMLRRLIGENIHLIWMPATCLWPIKMDPSQIDQILVNLCINARDAIAGVGKITVETENSPFNEEFCDIHEGSTPREYVRIAVSDTGNGMDKETLAHIFEPFFTTKGVGEGTGLGLATVYGAVKQNNGYINANSEPGRGTTFTIYIPRYTDKVLPATGTVAGDFIPFGTETILLVEDEPMILKMTTQMLVGQGYRVLGAASPWEAIRLAKEHAGSIDLLMTDVIMPEMNGRDLAKNLLVISPNIKRLFMSGYTANVIEPHCVLGDGVNFIQKPFNMKDLASAVRKAIES